MNKIILFCTTLIYLNCNAKETWFGITGINTRNAESNYSDFYTESNNFLSACKKKSDRICNRYINTDTSLAPKGTKIIGESKGAAIVDRAAQAGILNEIKNAINNAKQGDQIVIALNNHGGPGWDRDQRDLSCIFVNNKQKICNSDLEKIIQDLPEKKGFKVAIVASGCFSGGFNSLSSKNVCVATTADQQRAGYGTKFWQSVNEQNPKTLAELGGNYYNSSNPYDSTMLASQYMEKDGCKAVQSYFNNKKIKQKLLKISNAIRSTNTCNENLNYRHLNKIKMAATEIETRLNDQELKKDICAASSYWCNIINKISTDFNKILDTQNYASNMQEITNLQSEINNRIGQEYAACNAAEVKAVSMYINYQDESLIGQIPINRQQIIRQRMTAFNQYMTTKKSKIQQKQLQLSQFMSSLKNSTAAKELNQLISCVNLPIKVNENSSLIRELETQSQTRRRLTFSEQQKQDARACEENFTF